MNLLSHIFKFFILLNFRTHDCFTITELPRSTRSGPFQFFVTLILIYLSKVLFGLIITATHCHGTAWQTMRKMPYKAFNASLP